MEILNKNLINTTTSVVVNSNTSTVENLMRRDLRFQYASNGFNDDTTISTLKINFDETLSVSRIALLGTNLKDFTVYYNGTTASTFSLTSTGATSASDFSTNSETALYLQATPVNCTSVSIDMQSTQVANSNKAIGYLVISNVLSDLNTRVPKASDYRPIIEPKEVVHELSDGSFRSQVFDRKYGANVGLSFVETSLRNELKTVWDLHDDIIFVAFGTTTSWDEIIFPCIWQGQFDFHKYSDNAAGAGHTGRMKFLETNP